MLRYSELSKSKVFKCSAHLILLTILVYSAELSAKELGSGALRRASQFNYPQLPAEVMNRIHGNRPSLVSANSQVDTLLSQDWSLVNIGFFETFTPLVQPIKGSIQNCSNEVVVAVIDTGIDYTHPELRESIWVNAGESGPWTPSTLMSDNGCRDKSCNGLDDDSNGFIDDVVGWDFVNNQALPYDTHGHGTHIAGIIAAASANGLGTTGICSKVTVMPLKYYDNSGAGYNNLQNTVKAIQYAVKMGANIINYSGGGADPAATERGAIEEAQHKGILFVAAAGNDGHNNTLAPYYPASYPLDNVIGVASVNQRNQLLPSSNFGTTVHLAAPGLSILSTLPNGRFGTMSGTSQATAFVTGTAALLASQYKEKNNFDYHKVKQWILDGSKPLPGNDKNSYVSAGLLSVPGSLSKVKTDEVKKATPAVALVPSAKPTLKHAQ